MHQKTKFPKGYPKFGHGPSYLSVGYVRYRYLYRFAEVSIGSRIALHGQRHALLHKHRCIGDKSAVPLVI
jgi:hypothetical protein